MGTKLSRPHLTYAPRDLQLTDDEYQKLHEALDKTRANSVAVKVDKVALSHLLMDHGAFWRFIGHIDGQLSKPVSERETQPEPVDQKPVDDGGNFI